MSLRYDVGEPDAGARLDVWLVRHVEGMSRAKARRMIEEGSVRLNGRRVRKGARVASGDAIELEHAPPPSDFVAPRCPDLELVVRYQDERLTIVDKPAGLPTHPLRVDDTRTLAGALLARYPEMEGVGYSLREPGIVHRLDNDTSGLVLAARDAESFDALREALRAGRIDKRYLALVAAPPSVLRVEYPIAPHPSDPRRVHACIDTHDRLLVEARDAVTEIVHVEARGPFALVELRVNAAVRHQIRAHLAALGCPLVGDWLYGGPEHDGLRRHFLHASEIAFDHPFTGELIRARSPLPSELAALLAELAR
ncbi:MAG: RluA family pseudouridine synthase [Sandaracinaceae bacterium]|nr:RluA family pseudouridine synthase [Sandaracinaceae bacterium]